MEKMMDPNITIYDYLHNQLCNTIDNHKIVTKTILASHCRTLLVAGKDCYSQHSVIYDSTLQA